MCGADFKGGRDFCYAMYIGKDSVHSVGFCIMLLKTNLLHIISEFVVIFSMWISYPSAKKFFMVTSGPTSFKGSWHPDV